MNPCEHMDGLDADLANAGSTIRQLEAENAALRKQLAAAQKDAERYLWLRSQGYGGWAICRWDNGAGDYFRCILHEEKLDDAIDAAMKEGK